MSTEIELKLQLDPESAAQLPRHPLLAGNSPKTQLLLNTYFDTPTLTLHAQKIALRFRKKGEQWLCTIKTAEPATGGLARRSEWEAPASPGHFDFSHVDAPALRDILESMRDAFRPVFTTDFTRKTWLLPYGESTIEMAIDSGFVESRGCKAPISEIELELVSGRIADLFAVSLSLQEDFALHPALASKAERGYALFLGQALQPCAAQKPAIAKDLPPREAFRDFSLACLEIFQRNEAGIQQGNEADFLRPACQALDWLEEGLTLFRTELPEHFMAEYAGQWAQVAHTLASGETDAIRQQIRAKALSRLILAFTAALYAL